MILRQIFSTLLLVTGMLAGAVGAADFGVMGTTLILDSKTGQPIERQELLGRIEGQKFLLLGEVHDNETHHQQRGELIRNLQANSPVVVAEHLEVGKQFVPGADLKFGLEAAGFDAKGWRWPRHEALFAPIAMASIPLYGGNIARDDARRIVREGEQAIPANLVALVTSTPLLPEAREQLDASLIQGHCGQMDPAFLVSMRKAQEVKDAAMANTLLQRAQEGKSLTILVAGNGHVRRDYGVPRFLPQGSYITVGFVERQPELAEKIAGLRQQFDYLWITDGVVRDDPCKNIKMPRLDESK